MEKLIKSIKIARSPFTSSIEQIGEKFVMMLHVPCSESDVTIKIHPNITEYKEADDSNPNIQIRQITVVEDTEDTQILHLDFKDDNTKKIIIDDTTFEIKLLNIGKINIQGQDFPEFEFLISEI